MSVPNINPMKKIAVLSGKGGVGKSTVSVLISLVLSKNHKVLLLDYDLCGPSCTRALNAKGSVLKAEKGLKPIKINNNLSLISMGLMMSDTDPVIWRGPKKLSVLNLFYESISDYDFVIFDTPPGVSEEHGFLIGKDIEAVIVTTSQNIALSDTVKAVDFCNTNEIPIRGVIENMNSYICSCCGEDNHPFASNGGKLLAEEYNLEYLCGLSIDTKLSKFMDDGELKDKYEESPNSKVLEDVIHKLF